MGVCDEKYFPCFWEIIAKVYNDCHKALSYLITFHKLLFLHKAVISSTAGYLDMSHKTLRDTVLTEKCMLTLDLSNLIFLTQKDH